MILIIHNYEKLGKIFEKFLVEVRVFLGVIDLADHEYRGPEA